MWTLEQFKKKVLLVSIVFLITFGFTILTFVNTDVKQTNFAYSLPFIMSFILTCTLVFLVPGTIVRFKMTTPIPAGWPFWRKVLAFFEGPLIIINLLTFSFFPFIEAQTRTTLRKLDNMKYLEITRLIKRYYLTLPIHLKDLKESYYSQFINILVINTGLVIGQLIYVYLRLPYLNENIPFWYSMPWGSGQLAPKSYLYLIPVLSVVIFLGGVFLTTLAKRFFIKYLPQMMALIVTVTNVMLT